MYWRVYVNVSTWPYYNLCSSIFSLPSSYIWFTICFFCVLWHVHTFTHIKLVTKTYYVCLLLINLNWIWIEPIRGNQAVNVCGLPGSVTRGVLGGTWKESRSYRWLINLCQSKGSLHVSISPVKIALYKGDTAENGWWFRENIFCQKRFGVCVLGSILKEWNRVVQEISGLWSLSTFLTVTLLLLLMSLVIKNAFFVSGKAKLDRRLTRRSWQLWLTI